MKHLITFLSFALIPQLVFAQLVVTEVGTLPVRISNNAVCEGFIDGDAYLFSFGGIDSTKQFSGIHLKSYRYNIQTGETLQLPDLPDDMGKIAAGASRIGDIIYIAGGYYVFANGNEESSDKMHRYDVANNVFLSDAQDIPLATDDHVQVVWRDSLIYLITGWRDFTNIPNVQIYNPALDSWEMGTSVPNNNSYKSFGASGAIVNDTIYYFGGASSGFGFGAQNQLRKGLINPDDPTQIDWSISIPDSDIRGYRMAATTVGDGFHWVGGSSITYNFDGIAYNGSGGVPPTNRDLFLDDNQNWQAYFPGDIPMDVRGIAKVTDSLQYIAGGMLANQEVTNKVFRLEWTEPITNVSFRESELDHIQVFPNPFQDRLYIMNQASSNAPIYIELYNSQGQSMLSQSMLGNELEINTEGLSAGIYFVKVYGEKGISSRKIVK